MKLSVKTTVGGPLVLAFQKRELWRIIAGALVEAGEFYAQHFTESHFERAASRKYGYARRVGEGASPGSKLFNRVAGPAEKWAGEILPLVHGSGRMKGPMLREGARTYRIRTTVKSTKMEMDVLRPRAQKANLRPRKAPQINMREDLTRASDHEQAVIKELLNRALNQRLVAVADQKVLQQRSWGGI